VFLHGDYDALAVTTRWSGSVTHTLPASWYLTAKPAWWGAIPYPSIGPEITTGDTWAGQADSQLSNPAERCYFKVMGGVEGGGGGPYSFSRSLCYTASGPVPGAPTGLTATPSGTNIVLNWTASTGTVNGYTVLRSLTSGGPYSQIATGILTTTYTDVNPPYNTYYYVVYGYNSNGNSPNSNEATATGGVVNTVVTPTFSPVPGSFVTTVTVTITTTTSGATICYTVDGSTPTGTAGSCTHGTTLTNGGSVVITTTTTLNAIGTLSPLNTSGVATGVYTITQPLTIAPAIQPILGVP
jgi:hypothetical protein